MRNTSVVTDITQPDSNPSVQDLGYYGITQEELDAYLADPIEPTAENSPGNPAFIDIGFTQEEYDSAITLTAPVSRENPTADFPELDMHVDLKWWNLENDEDTLIVKQMPAKTCPVTGVEIYSYDYSLASGQNEFPTEVEVTAPILGDPDIFTGVLHQNEETGKWEEDCFTISEDGKYYTAYMSHFSGDGPVYDKSGLEKMKQQGIEATKYYQEDGKCLFRIMPYQDEAKYPGSNTWLYGIGLVKMPDFERFVSQDDKYAQKILDDMLNKTGGVPAEAGLAEAYSAIGAENDKYSAVMAGLDPGVQKLIEKYSKSSAFKEAASKVSTGISTIMWGFGTDVLGMRMIDQYERGVSTKKIVKSNAVGVISAVVGAVGTGASLLGEATVTIAPAVSLACSAVCAGIYIGGEIKASADAKFKKDFPLGYGDTLEKYAYFHYLSYYEGNSAMGIESPRYLLRKVVNEIPPPDGSINSSAYDKPININGDGWSNALRLIFTHYKSDPVKMAQVTDKLINEYEACIERFWDSAQSMLRDSCWRESCIKMLSPTAAPELRVDDSWWEDSVYGSKLTNSKSVTKHKADVRAFAAKYQLPLSQAWRSHDLANWADSYFGAVPTGAQWGEAWYYGDPKTYRDYSGEFFDPSADSDSEYAASSTFYPNRIETGFVNYVSDFEYFDEITEEEIKQLKEHALNSFHENINPIVYSYQQHFRNKCIKDLRNRLYDEVLPWLNTRVTFYMKDTSLPEGSRQSDSLYTDFEFVCDKHAYFNPSLMEKDDASAAYLGYGLYLKRSMTESADGMISTLASSPVLLETNVYHYLRYGCPTEVNIKALDQSIPAVKGAADWTGVELKTDPGSMYNALPKDKQIDGMFLDAGDLNAFYKPIKDLKVPIVFEGTKKEETKDSEAEKKYYDMSRKFELVTGYITFQDPTSVVESGDKMAFNVFEKGGDSNDESKIQFSKVIDECMKGSILTIDEKGSLSFSGQGFLEFEYEKPVVKWYEGTPDYKEWRKSAKGTVSVDINITGTPSEEDLKDFKQSIDSNQYNSNWSCESSNVKVEFHRKFNYEDGTWYCDRPYNPKTCVITDDCTATYSRRLIIEQSYDNEDEYYIELSWGSLEGVRNNVEGCGSLYLKFKEIK